MMKKYQVKAGRFHIDNATNKVKPDKSKGKLIVERNEQEETHFRWINLQTKMQQLDLIVFSMDAKFQAVPGKNNTFLLRFQTDSDKYYFWMQEKVQNQQLINQIMKIINSEIEEPELQSINQIEEEKPQKIQIILPEKQEKPAIVSQKPTFSEDFISRLTKNLTAAQKNQQPTITHLDKILNYGTIGQILKSLSEQEKLQLLEYLPQQQQDIKKFDSNVRSAQFLQATDVLSDALNSQTAIAIFAEMGLNQNYLQKYYGVHAFLKALIDWGKQQK